LQTLDVKSIERSCQAFWPTTIEKEVKLPLLIALHGDAGTTKQA
jgi:hypothetical protein